MKTRIIGVQEKMKKIFTTTITSFAALLLFNCTSLSLQRKGSTPSWAANHPISRTNFIGIGCAKIDDDLHSSQKLARNRALLDIAEQIQVAIVSDVRMSAHSTSVNKTIHSDKSYQEKIAAFSQAVLTDWEEVRTYQAPNGYFWSKVVLSKKKYHEQVNKKLKHAIAEVCDILRYAQTGTAHFRIHELHRGFAVIDKFFGTPLKARINGKTVLLHNELQRAMARLLESIEIKPTVNGTTLPSAGNPPQNLGAYVYCEGILDRSLSVAWTASKSNVHITAAAVRDDGMHPVSIISLPASSGSVTITATPLLKKISYDLIRRKFSLPSGSFTLHRQKASVYIDNRSGFCRSLAQKLADRSAITLVRNRGDAEFILTTDLTKESEIALTNSVYTADANLVIALLTPNGNTVFSHTETIQTCDGISADRALNNTQKYALEVAVRRVERIF